MILQRKTHTPRFVASSCETMKLILSLFLTLAVNAASTCHNVTEVCNILLDSTKELGLEYPLEFEPAKFILNQAIKKAESLDDAEVALLNNTNCPSAFFALGKASETLKNAAALIEAKIKALSSSSTNSNSSSSSSSISISSSISYPTFIPTEIKRTLVVYFVYFNDSDLSNLPSNETNAKHMKTAYGKNQKEESVNDIYNRISFGQFKFKGLNSEDVDYVGWTKIDTPSSQAHMVWKFEKQHIGGHNLIQVLLFNLVRGSRS